MLRRILAGHEPARAPPLTRQALTAPPERLSAALADRYRLERELGQGGMATVYLAQDLKHQRQVAIKVLRPELAAVLGAERFVQEIKTTAALNHPHILPLFDSGETGGFLYYVMPYIEGETIRDKLDRETQLGVDEAVRIAMEVADALEYAHEQGVIHRDIKPENILLSNGRALVADFGIALAVSAAAGGRMTETGLSLGTPYYMSPEQATADRNLTARSDVYSLGSVLYEMLAGRPPHGGASAQQIIVKIVTDTAAPVSELRRSVPPNVAAAVAKALEKLPADRFATAAEFAEALENPAFTTAAAGTAVRATAPPFRRSAAPAVVAAITIFAALAAWGWLRPRPSPTSPVRRYVIQLAAGQEVGGWFRRVALSPDGSRLAYLHEGAAGERHLLVLPRDQFRAIELAGTGGAEVPFFSPDGAMLGFISPRGTIKVVPVTGGEVVPVATGGIGYAGATWAEDGMIYADGSGGGLVRVPAGGGRAAPFTTPDTAAGETDHVWPYALPGRGILFVIKYSEQTGRSAIAVADQTTGVYRILTEGLYAEYVPGHLVFAAQRLGPLMIQAFDARTRRLAGEARVVAEDAMYGGVGALDQVPDFTISRDGTLIYTASSDTGDTTDVVWVTRDGVTQPVAPGWTDQLTLNGAVMLSPDGLRLAVTLRGQIWIRQLDRGTMTQLTFDGGFRPEWTPDGSAVAYVWDRDPARKGVEWATRKVLIRRSDGTGTARPLMADSLQAHEVVFSTDGRWIVYRTGGGGKSDLMALRRDDDSVPVPLVVTPYQEAQPVVSPDVRWLAYVTLETGRPQVRVRPFPNTSDGNWLVSPTGGTEPAWAHSGRELFYRDGDGNLVSVPITPGPTFVFGAPRVLFSARAFHAGYGRREYTVAPDDRRFIFVRLLSPPAPDRIVVIENLTHSDPVGPH